MLTWKIGVGAVFIAAGVLISNDQGAVAPSRIGASEITEQTVVPSGRVGTRIGDTAPEIALNNPKGKAMKLAEIAAGLVLAGELSLGAATKVDKVTRKNEWVDAHERLGRNR